MKPKKLKWGRAYDMMSGGYWEATPIYDVTYSIYGSTKDGFSLISHYEGDMGEFKTLREAKAAAQAHFEKQVMRCLE